MTKPTEKQIKYFNFLANKFKRDHSGFTPHNVRQIFNSIDIWNNDIQNKY